MRDDPVQPRPERPVRVVLIPSLERSGEGVVRHIGRRVRVTQDRIGDAVHVIGVVPVRPLDRLTAELVLHHILSTRQGRSSLQAP